MSSHISDGLVQSKGSRFRERFNSWKRDKRGTQSFKASSKKENSTVKRKFISMNSMPNLHAAKPRNLYHIFNEGAVKVHRLGLVRDVDIFMKFLQHTKSSRSYESHFISLNDDAISSCTPVGVFTTPLLFSSISEVDPMDLEKDPYCYFVRISSTSMSFLLQTSNAHQRDQCLHTIRWKMAVSKSRLVLAAANQADILLKEFQKLVDLTLESPLVVSDTQKLLIDIVSSMLAKKMDAVSNISDEALIMTLAPLLDQNQPSFEICSFFIEHCRRSPRSILVIEMFTPIIQHILKSATGVSNENWLRNFVIEYILALKSQNNGIEAVQNFVHTLHGPLNQCPHKCVLKSLMNVCNSAICRCFAKDKPKKKQDVSSNNRKPRVEFPSVHPEKGTNNILNNAQPNPHDQKSLKNAYYENTKTDKDLDDIMESVKILNTEIHPKADPNLKESYSLADKRLSVWEENPSTALSEDQLECLIAFVEVLKEIAKMPDWCLGMAPILQPLPFPTEALRNIQFTRLMYPIVEIFAEDDRETVIRCLCCCRAGQNDWLKIYSPGGAACEDEGVLFTKMMSALLKPKVQTGKLKKFLTMIAENHLDVIIMLALRENLVMISVLRDMLEMGILMKEQAQLQVVSALRCTPAGKDAYNGVKTLLESLSHCNSPKQFTLPPNSTGADLETLLRTGAWGGLESLTLSSTRMSSESWALIAGLRNLKYLNLCSTNIDDDGLRLLCDGLDLEHLNLCETLVTGEGIQCLKAMQNLSYLNLNSTVLDFVTFSTLKGSLHSLKEYNIDYTDASVGM